VGRMGCASPGGRNASVVYVAFLRGINVGGKNIVSMASLKANFEQIGLQDVSTYINSGNVLFRAAPIGERDLEARIDRMLSRKYRLKAKTVVRSHPEMARLMKTMTSAWKSDRRWRYNVIFLRREVDSERVLAGIDIKRALEHVVYCPGTLLWSARLSASGRTAMVRLSTRPVYQEMTVRNANTASKIFALMQRMQRGRAPGE
jgi:uncharacterized protein (DUF1697 family)